MNSTHGQPCSARRSERSSLTIRGREYHLSVALPDSYKTSTQAYPVIYVLDGDFNFGVAAGLTRFSNWFRKVPELIIVGIGYDMETSDQLVELRDLDFDIPEVPGAPPAIVWQTSF